ncbi:CE1759 family FMN reductase [Zhihengliuella flava]|uniref:FMN reductase n=1 Tax=Zhihengliuella flava TaxID=1285193 RepID=A0A931GIA6_9MICC|nr:CE1759 family FMN reductase [Zhihengliuella flava]MBG6084066.1 FMN reductase [Zhihengliuella flava]
MAEQRMVVLSGGLSSPSTSRMLGEMIADAAASAAGGRGLDVGYEVIELRPLASEIARSMVAGFASGEVQNVLERVRAADALVVVSPVFTASISGLLKSLIDLMDPQSIVGKPVLLAATGGSVRHSLVIDYAMRPIFAYLKAAILPTGVFAAPADWGAGDGDAAGEPLSERVRRAGLDIAHALAGAAEVRGGVDHGASGQQNAREETASFAELLAGVNGNRLASGADGGS